MSLDIESCVPATVDSPRRQLKPLILVERAKHLQLQRGGSSAMYSEPLVPSSSPPQAVDFPRKVIINKPHTLFRAKSENALPTPPQTPTLSADSHENERGRSNSVLQYHLPFRTIRLSSSPEPASFAITEDTVLNTLNPGTSINSGGGLRSYPLDPHAIMESSENPTFRFRDSIPSLPPRPASRMSWCSTTTTSSDKTMMATSPPWASNSPPRHHHRRSQSFGNGQSRISFESFGSSGTFGLRTKDSSNSVPDHGSITEVNEEDLEVAGGDEGDINEQGESESSTPTMPSSKLLPVTVTDRSSLGRPPMKQLSPVQTVVPEAGQSPNESIDAPVSSFEFPSFPPNSSIQTVLCIPTSHPNMRTAISAPAAPIYSACDLTIAPSRHRGLSLPTCMPTTSPTEPSIRTLTAKREIPTDSSTPPGHPTTPDTKPRRVPRKSASPSIPSLTPTSNPNTISSTRTIRPPPPQQQHGGSPPTDDQAGELVLRRESSATVDTAETGDTTTSTGTVTSKRVRFRKSIGTLFHRLFLERRASRGGVNTP